MAIVIEKPKVCARGKRAAHFVARTSETSDALEICKGAVGETAAQVKAHATDLLAASVEQRTLSVRMVLPGLDGPCDVWVLQGDPVFGYEYGRMFRSDDRFRVTCSFKAANGQEALTSMLTHMADRYPPVQWPQFLWGAVNTDAIRREITELDAKRAGLL